MADFEFEPEEDTTLRHAPGWLGPCIAAIVLLAEFAVVAAASAEIVVEPARYQQGTLAMVIVATLFGGAVLQFLVLVMPPLVEVTDRRILLRRRLGLDDPDTLRLDAVDDIRQQGWRMAVSGGETSLEFFCPPAFAPRIRAAVERARKAP